MQLALGIVTLSGFTFEEEAQVVLFPVLYLAGQVIHQHYLLSKANVQIG